MSDERKKRREWPWIVVAIAVPILYLAHFGPANWLYWKMDRPDWLHLYLLYAQKPVYWILLMLPDPISMTLEQWYNGWNIWWIEQGVLTRMPT